MAAVVTLGSASARPDPDILGSMLAATPWFIGTDNDPAGDRAAGDWPASARRVPPPMLPPHPAHRIEKAKTDWTQLHRHRGDLPPRWIDPPAGIEAPPLFPSEGFAGMRWG